MNSRSPALPRPCASFTVSPAGHCAHRIAPTRPKPHAAAALAAALLAAAISAPPAALAQSNPGDVPILFTSPVQGTVVLDTPGSQAYQVYAPSGPLVTLDASTLILTDGALIRFGGTIINDGFLELRRDPSSGLVGAIAIQNNGAALTFTNNRIAPNAPGTLGGGLLMRGGSIYNPYNFTSPTAQTARLINGLNHVITNAGSSTAYTGNFSGLQLTNAGDIASVRPGGVLNFSLSSLSNIGGAGQHENTATGRIFAYDSGTIHFSIRHGGGIGINNPFNTFTNHGLIKTRDNVLYVGSDTSQLVFNDGGTIRFSSLVNTTGTGWTPGVFQGNNPEIDWNGRLELAEIRFVNTLPPAAPGGTPIAKTLTADRGTIRLERGVTIEGGRVRGDTTDSRFEIGFGGAPAGAFANTFQDVEFDGTFFTNGHVRLLGTTDISAATFRPLVAGGGYTLALGADLTLATPRTYFGRAGFTTDSSVTKRTLTLDAALTAPESIAFGNLALAGSGAVVSPVIRLTSSDFDLSSYGGLLKPQAGGQLRLEGGTFGFPFSPQLSSAGATLVLDGATLDLRGQSLAPLGLNTSVRLENNATLHNGRLAAGFGPGGTPTGTFHVEQGRLLNLTFEGLFTVGQSVILQNARPTGVFTGFDGTNYTVTFASALDLAGATLLLHSTGGGTVTLDTTPVNGQGVPAMPTHGTLLADRLRLTSNVGGFSGNTLTLAAGSSGELHLTLGASATGTNSAGQPTAFSFLGGVPVTGDLRLDYAPDPTAWNQPAQVEVTLFDRTGLSVDGRLTVLSHVTLNPSQGAFYVPPTSVAGEQYLPSAVAARAFTFENNSLSGLHLRPFDPATPATVDVAGEITLAQADTTTLLNGGTFLIQDSTFFVDPADASITPWTTAVVSPPGPLISSPGSVQSDGTLILSGLALTGYVSESFTPLAQLYLPRTLPEASQLGTITAQHITLRHGTQAHTRYESERVTVDDGNVVGDEITRRWTLAPNLVATGDQALGTLGELRLETGRYSLESTWTYGRLVVGDGATLTRRSLLTAMPGSSPRFIGDSLSDDPDLNPLPDSATELTVRAGFDPVTNTYLPGPTFVFDGGRLEGMTLRSLPEPYSYGTGSSGALVQSRATFDASSQLIGTLDHAAGAVTRFEAGYVFARGAIDSYTTEYEPQLLRSANGLAAGDRHFGLEITAADGPAPVPVTIHAPELFEESTRLSGNVTVTGVAAPAGGEVRAQLLLESDTSFFQSVANLHHSGGDLTFAGPLDVIVNGGRTFPGGSFAYAGLFSTGRTTFESGVGLSGTGVAESTGGFQLNGQTLPGNSPGTLTFVGDVTFGDTHNLILELGGAPWNSDRLAVQGDLTLAGSLTLVFTEGYNSLGGAFTWFTGPDAQLLAATSISGTFATLELQGLSDPSTFQLSDLARILPAGSFVGIQVIPEPGTYAACAALAALTLAVWQRRRRAAHTARR